MGFDIQLGYLPQTFVLVAARFGGVIAAVPFYGGNRVPAQVRAAFVLILTLMFIPMVPQEWAVTAGTIHNVTGLVLAVLGEVVLGAAVGMVVLFFTNIFTIAGDFISHGAGLMMAKEVDPLSNISNTMIANMLQMSFVLIVVLNDGHLILLKLVADSFFKIPPQVPWITGDWIYGMISLGSAMFEFAVRLAFPVVAVELVLNVGFALIARIAPDINILFLSMPVRLVAALAVLGLMIHFGAYFFTSAASRMLEALAGILS